MLSNAWFSFRETLAFVDSQFIFCGVISKLRDSEFEPGLGVKCNGSVDKKGNVTDLSQIEKSRHKMIRQVGPVMTAVYAKLTELQCND